MNKLVVGELLDEAAELDEPVGSELERDGESGFLARIGYFESVFLFGLFALSLEVAFFENEHQSGAEMLAGPIALGLAVTIALRARLPGVWVLSYSR